MKNRRFAWFTRLFALFAFVATASGALAQGPVKASAAQEAELDAVFEQLLRKPDDVPTVLEYARLSAAVGDYEAAIGALERLLVITSNLPTVRADLGIFYYRLGSYGVARHHLGTALASNALSAEVASRAQQVLDDIDRRARRHRFSGAISFGARWQSNANSGPSSSTVLANGFAVTLDERFREQSDVNAFSTLSLRHEFDLQTQSAAAFETELFAFGSLFADENDLNNRFVELTPGLRFTPLPADVPGLSIRPHVLANREWLGGDLNSHAVGFGLDARYAPGGRWSMNSSLQRRLRDYDSSAQRPRNGERSGHETLFSVRGLYGFSRELAGTLGASVIDRDARRPGLSSTEYNLGARLILEHASPVTMLSGRWQSSVSIGFQRTVFDGPDAVVDPNRSRGDTQWRAALRTEVPLDRWWRVSGETAYATVDSNLPNFDRDNLSVSIVATRRF